MGKTYGLKIFSFWHNIWNIIAVLLKLTWASKIGYIIENRNNIGMKKEEISDNENQMVEIRIKGIESQMKKVTMEQS